MIDFKSTINNKLTHYDNIIFMLYGELGWEIILFSGFIRSYAKNNPNKNVYVMTRTSRRDLYEGVAKKIYTFDIPNDYVINSPQTNNIKKLDLNDDFNLGDFLELEKLKVIDDLNLALNEYTFYDFSHLQFSRIPIFNLKDLDYNYTPNKTNVKKIVGTYGKYKARTNICVFPRHRVDISHRNWCNNPWPEFYEFLHKEDKYNVFICGQTPGYIRPNPEYKNFFVLEDMLEDNSNASLIGLTIEAIRKSKFSFGIQSYGCVLSNIFKVPNLYIGMEEDLITKNHNPYNNISQIIQATYINDHEYNMPLDKVIEKFKIFSDTILKSTVETQTKSMVYKLKNTIGDTQTFDKYITQSGNDLLNGNTNEFDYDLNVRSFNMMPDSWKRRNFKTLLNKTKDK